MMNVSQNIKLYFITLFFLLISSISFAHHPKCSNVFTKLPNYKVFCDLCGCSTNSGSFGFGTLNNANFIGVRFLNQSFESKNGIFSDSPISKETINTYQLWTQIPIKKVFMLSVNLPYQSLKREFKGETERLNGIGDASLIGWYKHVFYKKNKENTKVDFNTLKEPTGHSVQIGIGAKLPTGKFEQRLTDAINPGFQVGTGSLDGIFSLGYNYGSDVIGVNALATYYLKTENKNDYQFGNQISLSLNTFTAIQLEALNIMPFVGMSYDNFDTITQFEETLANTDGTLLSASLGSEFVVKDFIFGANYAIPVEQELFNGDVKAKPRFSIYLNIAL